MELLSKVPLYFQSIFIFTLQHIFLAQFQYYIKGDITQAFQILNTTKDKILPYKLDTVTSELKKEIQILEREVNT